MVRGRQAQDGVEVDGEPLGVDTRKATDLTPGSRRLFDFQTGSGNFDVSPDGKRLLVNDAGEASVPRVALVTNWTAELQKR